jgi:hypothetical protein
MNKKSEKKRKAINKYQKNKVKVPYEEFEKRMLEQIEFLKNSIKNYNDGVKGEAKRIAVAIRVLFHSSRNSKPLLSQLKIKNKIKYISFAQEDKPNMLSHLMGLVSMKAEQTVSGLKCSYERRSVSRLMAIRKLSFDEWWNEKIFDNRKGLKFSRKNLILEIANTDGGAHSDDDITENYSELIYDKPFDWVVGNGKFGAGPTKSFENDIVPETVVCIGEEFLQTIDEYYRK